MRKTIQMFSNGSVALDCLDAFVLFLGLSVRIDGPAAMRIDLFGTCALPPCAHSGRVMRFHLHSLWMKRPTIATVSLHLERTCALELTQRRQRM